MSGGIGACVSGGLGTGCTPLGPVSGVGATCTLFGPVFDGGWELLVHFWTYVQGGWELLMHSRCLPFERGWGLHLWVVGSCLYTLGAWVSEGSLGCLYTFVACVWGGGVCLCLGELRGACTL